MKNNITQNRIFFRPNSKIICLIILIVFIMTFFRSNATINSVYYDVNFNAVSAVNQFNDMINNEISLKIRL